MYNNFFFLFKQKNVTKKISKDTLLDNKTEIIFLFILFSK